MKYKFTVFFLTISIQLFGQTAVENFGYRHFQIEYLGDNVEFIVKSKKGEEKNRKPLLIFIQGSLAKPLIKYKNDGNHYPPFPFSEQLFTDKFHLVAINKPGVPLLENENNLSKRGEFVDIRTGLPFLGYTKNNNLEYYTERNGKVLRYLLNQDWVDSSVIVVAGHSEGSSIATKMATKNKNITHLIYSGGTIYYPRILSMVSQDRETETKEESWVEKDFEYWNDVNENPTDISREHGFNSYKGTYSFSESLNIDLKELKIPVLISYGTKDSACPFNDLFKIEVIQDNLKNIQFLSYIGLEHNYFPIKNDKIDYSKFGWDNVTKDWIKWINEN